MIKGSMKTFDKNILYLNFYMTTVTDTDFNFLLDISKVIQAFDSIPCTYPHLLS